MKRKLMGMTTTDYVISASLILLVIPQIRGVRQTLHNTLLPLVAVAAAAAYYLKSFPTQGTTSDSTSPVSSPARSWASPAARPPG